MSDLVMIMFILANYGAYLCVFLCVAISEESRVRMIALVNLIAIVYS